MTIVTILVAAVLAIAVLKFLSGIVKMVVLGVIVVGALYFAGVIG